MAAQPQSATHRGTADTESAERVRGWLLAALTALYVARPLVPHDPVSDRGDGAIFVILWLLLTIAWVLHFGFQRRLAVRWGAADVALYGMVGWLSLSGLFAVWQASPRPAINVLWQWVALAIGFFLVRQLVATAAEARAVLVAMIALAVALAVLGAHQRFFDYPQDRARYEQIKDDPRKMIETVGEYFPPGSPARMQFESRLRANEPTATFALTNSLAGYLAPWLVVAIGLGRAMWPAVAAAGRGVACRAQLALLVLPIAGTLVLTKSRSGVLACCAGLAVLWPILRSHRAAGRGSRAAGAAIGLAVIMVAIVVAGGIDRRLLDGAGKSLGYRLDYWRSTLEMIVDHPSLGCGPGQFQDVYTQYKLPRASEEIRDPHNLVLEVWATAGTPAVLALLLGLALFAYRLKTAPGRPNTRVPATPADRSTYVTVGAAAGLVLAALVAPLSGFPLELAPTAVTALALAGGLLIGRAWTLDREGGRLDHQQIAALAAVGALVLLINLLAAGGIGYPGVAGTLWLLLAVGLNSVSDPSPPSTRPRNATAIGLTATGVLLLACYLTAYQPVLKSRALMTRAMLATGRDQAHVRATCLQDAVRADPLSRDAAQLLAGERFWQWQRDPTPERVRQLRAAVQRATRLAPRTSSLWSQAGQWWLAVHRQSAAPRAIEWALDAHRQAVQCYPNSAQLRARYAVALDVANAPEAARQQAVLSLELDAIAHRAGHRDKWLDDDLRGHAERIAGDS